MDTGTGLTRRQRLKIWLTTTWQALHPGRATRIASAIAAVLTALAVATIIGTALHPGLGPAADAVVTPLALFAMIAVVGLIAALVLKLSAKAAKILPAFITWTAIAAIAGTTWVAGQFGLGLNLAIKGGIVIFLLEIFFAGGLVCLLGGGLRKARWFKKVFVAAVIVVGIAGNIIIVRWTGQTGSDDYLVKPVADSAPVEHIGAPDPALPGNFGVATLTYGSGTNKHLPEFADKADLKTQTLDVSPFAEKGGWRGKVRDWYWGFDLKHAPVNGRVWYPKGDGPFPLVLIVHGNHNMEDISHPGYAYLGELLATRGFILVSVDENFLNCSSWLADLGDEIDARAWMLLQHLKTWQEWNDTPGNPFFCKVDMNNIALMGHSRGGESAAVAAAFNRLSRYPEDAKAKFDFNFNIKGVVAIAPCDGRYWPAGHRTTPENINYLTLVGAHDADMFFFAGLRQYYRVKFTDGNYHFKAAVYNYRSNHGQYNTVWGRNDFGWPTAMFLNRKPLLTGDQQRKIGKTYISAFLEATLHGKTEYLSLFRNNHAAPDWLPEDIYATQFEDTSFKNLADYTEDIDLTTGTVPGAAIEGHNLTQWREDNIKFRHDWERQENFAAFIGWTAPDANSPDNNVPSYDVSLPAGLAAQWQLDDKSLLVFSLAATEQEPNSAPLDLNIELLASDGASVKIPLTRFKAIQPVMKSRFTRTPNERSKYPSDTEIALQTFELPLATFIRESAALNPANLAAVRLVFDKTSKGTIVLDRIGFCR